MLGKKKTNIVNAPQTIALHDSDFLVLERHGRIEIQFFLPDGSGEHKSIRTQIKENSPEENILLNFVVKKPR